MQHRREILAEKRNVYYKQYYKHKLHQQCGQIARHLRLARALVQHAGVEVGRWGGGEVAPLVRHKMFRVYSKTIKDKVVPASSCLCLSAEDTGGGNFFNLDTY